MAACLNKRSFEITSISFNGEPAESLLSREWLLTNNRGGYASSTIVGCNTRRYHGLLIGSLNPPADRVMALAQCLEMIIFDKQDSSTHKTQDAECQNVFNLATVEFEGKFAAESFRYIQKFRYDGGVHFEYFIPKLKLTKSVYLLPDEDVVVLVYDFTSVKKSARFVLRPLVGLRNFHLLQKSYACFLCNRTPEGLSVRHDVPDSCELLLNAPAMEYKKDQQWWFDFVYRSEKRRGMQYTEDLWTPGFFQCDIDSPRKIIIQAALCGPGERNQENPGLSSDIKEVQRSVLQHRKNVISTAGAKDKNLQLLSLAADKFIVERQSNHKQRTTILAGFPWFADWARDAFLALPGLLLATGRYDEAKSLLTTFAQAADDGMIPSRFDDQSGTAYFNSVDASLWFINAAFQYLVCTGDYKTFTQHILPAIRWIVDSYHKGTRFDIHADDDGLIILPNEQHQLTWMDAKYSGVAFTPRYGKAVEINALWYNGLCELSSFYTDRDSDTSRHYGSMADKVATSFRRLFWNGTVGYLNDCILPDGSVDSTLRPNQIFAVSLPFSALSDSQKKSVVEVVQQKLLTPYGLRTLDTDDPRYEGKYLGSQQERDRAYHQGTVWPYLMGPFVESYLKVNDFNRKSRKKALEFIQPLLQYLTEGNCLGNLPEIFDGDAPYESRGCIAQAWNVAELIRVYQLIT